jgi:hypothetical protein
MEQKAGANLIKKFPALQLPVATGFELYNLESQVDCSVAALPLMAIS